jgi:ABC-type glycerol-3-phosphate transport system permease component
MTKIGVEMDTKRPTIVTIAAILLVVLALFVAGLGIAGQFGLTRGNRQFNASQFRNRPFNPQNGGTFNGNPIGALPNGQNDQGTTPNFNRNFSGGTGLIRLFRFIQPITIGLDIAMLILAGIAAFGLFKGKRWALILAIVLAVLLILLTIPSMIRIFSAVVLIENLVRILLAVAVIVLLLLPVSRKAFAPVDDLDLDSEKI